MKIAIQSNKQRGKEIISLLESFGGKNTSTTNNTLKWEGNSSNPILYYYIDGNGYIQLDPCPKDYKSYTLEEFEKEFPFKVGDIVLLRGINDPYEIVALEWFMNKLCYKLDNGLHYAPKTLTTYKEMKEERNITLTLDKAKEWYNKGGELKEIALQAFTEKELNPLPRSWEEFSEKYCIKKDEAYINSEGKIITFTCKTATRVWDHVCPSKKSAEAHLAMIQLEQLRNCWWNGWEPEWRNSEKYVIKWEGDNLIVFTAINIHAFLIFSTREMAEEFLECFRDLIEKAGDLI